MVWTNIILEGYCLFDSLSKKKWIGYKIKDLKNYIKGKKIEHENKEYIPKSLRPTWCIKLNKRRVPQFRCLCYGKNDTRCPFFGYTNAEKGDYRFLAKKYRKKKVS